MPRVVIPLAAYRELGAFVSKEETRHYLKGICIETGAGVAVATDGHLLFARRVDPAEFIAADTGGADWIVELVPAISKAKAPAGFLRTHPQWVVIDRPDPASRAVTLYAVAASHAVLAIELPRAGILAMAAAELIEGHFPNWRRIFPAGGRRKHSDAYQALAEAVSRWESEAAPAERALDCARAALGAIAWHPPVVPAFNLRLLARIAAAFAPGAADAAPVRFHPGVSDADPVLIQLPDRPDAVGVLMPMRAGCDRFAAPPWALPAPAAAPAAAAE